VKGLAAKGLFDLGTLRTLAKVEPSRRGPEAPGARSSSANLHRPDSQMDDFERKPQETGRHQRAGISELPVRETHLFPTANAAGNAAVFIIRSGG